MLHLAQQIQLEKLHFLVEMCVDADCSNKTAESDCWVAEMWNEET